MVGVLVGCLSAAPSPWHLDDLPPRMRMYISQLLHKWRAKDGILYEEMRWQHHEGGTGGTRVWVALQQPVSAVICQRVCAQQHLLTEWRAERRGEDLQATLRALAGGLATAGTRPTAGLSTAVCALHDPDRVRLSAPDGLLTLSLIPRFCTLAQARRMAPTITASAQWSACPIHPAMPLLRQDDGTPPLQSTWLRAALPSATGAQAVGRALHPLGFGGDHSKGHLWIAFPDDQQEYVSCAFEALRRTDGLPFVFLDSTATCGPVASLCHICLVTAAEEVGPAAIYEWRCTSAVGGQRRVTLVSFSTRDALGVEALTLEPSSVPILANMERTLQDVLLPALAETASAYLHWIAAEHGETF